MLKAAAAKEEALLTTTYKEYAGHAMAIKGSAMWNLIYNPAENGAPLIPVSVNTTTCKGLSVRSPWLRFHTDALCCSETGTSLRLPRTTTGR